MPRRKEEEPLFGFEEDDDDDMDFWSGMEGDITAAQKKAVELFANPRGRAVFTLTDLSDREVRALTMLLTIADTIPDPILRSYVKWYALLKRSRRRQGVKEIISIVGGKAWRLLQNIQLTRQRRVYEGEM